MFKILRFSTKKTESAIAVSDAKTLGIITFSIMTLSVIVLVLSVANTPL